MAAPEPLESARLYRNCDMRRLDFMSTEALENLEPPWGQNQAMFISCHGRLFSAPDAANVLARLTGLLSVLR